MNFKKAKIRSITKLTVLELEKFNVTRDLKLKTLSRNDLYISSGNFNIKQKKPLLEDVENFIYLSKSDEDFNEAIRQIRLLYHSISFLSIFKISCLIFHFFRDSDMKVKFNILLLKALFNLNNTKKALDVFYDKSTSSYLNDKSIELLMELLYKEKKYGDVIKVFYEYLEQYKQSIPKIHFDILTRALIEIVPLINHFVVVVVVNRL